MLKNITYELPLNERIRTFLRLEFLFARVDSALEDNEKNHNRDAIDGLLDILSIFERSDLKAEILKELDRLMSALTALENTAGVNDQLLNDLLANIDQLIDSLHLNTSAIGQELRDNDFLYSIRQRSSISGGTCGFDLPAYHFWLQHTPAEERQQQLEDWSNKYSQARNAINLILELIRNGTEFNQVTAESGFYQQSLDSSQGYQLIRVQLAEALPYYPEISGGKHRFTVRFMHFDINQRAQQVTDDLTFSLSCCSM